MLWSHSTASEIVDAIAGDAEAGTLTSAESKQLIARVWHRTATEDCERLTRSRRRWLSAR